MKVFTANLERAILGEIILTGQGVEYLDSWWIDETSFSDEYTQKTYKALKWLQGKKVPIDAVMVVHALEVLSSEEPGLVVEDNWIYQISSQAPNSGNLESYVIALYETRNAEKCVE